MALIDFDPQVLTEITCTIGGQDFSQAVSSCKFSPNQTAQSFKGGVRTVSKMGRANYSCAMTVGQDWDTVASLVNYLTLHAGEEQPITYQLNGGATLTADIVLAAPEYGGDVDALLSSTITHGVNGVPTITPPAAG